ncbi:MAG TPA: helix-turn-helix transcriptional regulator [Ktedonobacterales bacterium]|nr:helix-turn-helix transcriptional regulator [Ktedonobacterales bacterium]
MRPQTPETGRANGVPVPQLATLRKRAGLSQRALAERARVSRHTISRLEQGAIARYTTIALLAETLHVTPSRLIQPPRRVQTEAAPNQPSVSGGP